MSEEITEIGVDEESRLYVKPSVSSFPFIYREAMEVSWVESLDVLRSEKPREWSHLDWFRQIISATAKQGVSLKVSASTIWVNISEELKSEIPNDNRANT